MQTKFNSSTPTDIDKLAIDDVVQYVSDTGDRNIASPQVRLNLTKMLYDVLGLTLTPDIALATIAEPRASLVLSTAGGGKTTWAQVKAILEKIMRKSTVHTGKKIRGDAILCLVYNKHNVSDMINRHKDMVARLDARGIKGLDIDNQIHACTLHSFCDFWRREYVAKMDLLGASLLEQAEAEAFMRRAIKTACKLLKCEKLATKIDPADVLGLYTYYHETMCESIDDIEDTDKFNDLNLDKELLETIFNRYDRAKEMQHRYDFVDMLYKFYCLLRDDNKIRERVHRYYEYVIADEVQDFTPLMWEILKLMVSDGTPLTCIGDEDQNIYSFRGADIYNTLSFDTMFEGGQIFSLEYNRRCGKRILDEARKIIEMNTLRFNKVLRHTKPGGTVTYKPYNTLHGQFVNVLRYLQSLPPMDLENTVICYREGVSSTILADMLMSEDIIFNVISGAGAFSHELYRHLIGIFDALDMPYDMQNWVTLYKVLPCSKEDFYNAICYDPARNKFNCENTRGMHFKDYDYGKLNNYKSFKESINALALISSQIESRPMVELIQPVFALLSKYFWTFKKTCNRFPEIDEIMQTRILKYFQSTLLYDAFFKEYQSKRSRYNNYSTLREGVTLSTFHSLKGLEFKNVVVVCMDDSIYPNFGLIESKNYSSRITTSLKEAEVRLWYVAVTRAKENLQIFYYKDNPSVFVTYALNDRFPIAGAFADDKVNREMTATTSQTDYGSDSSLFGEEPVLSDDLDDFADLDDLANPDSFVEPDVPETIKKNCNTPDDNIMSQNHTVGSVPSYSSAADNLDMHYDESDINGKQDMDIENMPARSISQSASLWPDTLDLIKASAPDSSKPLQADTNDDNKEVVHLNSGKSVYLQRLINSL